MSLLAFILVFCCLFLYKMAVEKDVSPWGYVGGFVAGFFVIMMATAAAIIFFYGKHVLNDSDAQKEIESFVPFAYMFDFLLFLFFRWRLDRIPDYHDDDDDMPPNDGEKKDLSYFR